MLSKFEWIPNSRENITNNKINCLSRFATCGWSRVGGAVTSLMIARFVSRTIKRLIKEIYRLSKQQIRAKNKSPHDTSHARAPNVAKKSDLTEKKEAEAKSPRVLLIFHRLKINVRTRDSPSSPSHVQIFPRSIGKKWRTRFLVSQLMNLKIKPSRSFSFFPSLFPLETLKIARKISQFSTSSPSRFPTSSPARRKRKSVRCSHRAVNDMIFSGTAMMAFFIHKSIRPGPN